jgi:MFS family permease
VSSSVQTVAPTNDGARESVRQTIHRNMRHNMIVNITDGGWYGFGLGFASFVTVIPLFVSTLTDSTVIIGLIASVHWIGWQVPQLFTANRVARLARYKPMALLMTIQERWPFWGLVLVAAALPLIGREIGLALTLLLIIWQSLGAGFTATPWQSMIAKIIPTERRGTFYGLQSAAANLFSGFTAVAAGVVLHAVAYPLNFMLCFFFAAVSMVLSFAFLAWTREPAVPVAESATRDWRSYLAELRAILRDDPNFRWFVASRALAQFAAVGTSFFTVYAVRRFDMEPQVAGVMTALFLFAQVIASPLLGWLGDRWGHRRMFAIGALLTALSTFLAIAAPDLSWMYIVFALAGLTNSTLWTTGLVMNSEFGTDTNRPYYIGLGNTLLTPATLLAPIIGGALADTLGFNATFTMATLGGLATAALLLIFVRDPRRVYWEARKAARTSSSGD